MATTSLISEFLSCLVYPFVFVWSCVGAIFSLVFALLFWSIFTVTVFYVIYCLYVSVTRDPVDDLRDAIARLRPEVSWQQYLAQFKQYDGSGLLPFMRNVYRIISPNAGAHGRLPLPTVKTATVIWFCACSLFSLYAAIAVAFVFMIPIKLLCHLWRRL